MNDSQHSPVRIWVTADDNISRWLWLVKWLLLIPHMFVLVFLWIGLSITTFIAFVAIVFTGRYPEGLFNYAVGVLRWSWRVGVYGYSALSTDRYPPFSLAAEEGYPAGLSIDYPGRMSRGKVWVKSWLLAFPHLLIIGALSEVSGLAVLVIAVALLFTGRMLPGLLDLAIGCQRWMMRTTAYVLLLTDAYPPFRLDLGTVDPTPVSGQEA